MESLSLTTSAGCQSVTILGAARKKPRRGKKRPRRSAEPRGRDLSPPRLDSSSSRVGSRSAGPSLSSLRCGVDQFLKDLGRKRRGRGDEESAPSDSILDLQSSIASRRAAVEKTMMAELPSLAAQQRTAQGLVAALSLGGGPCPQSMLKEAHSQSRSLCKEIQDRKDGIALKRFDERSKKYLRAMRYVEDQKLMSIKKEDIKTRFEEKESGLSPTALVDKDMTCVCGRPLVVVVEGALVGCQVCRTVERLQTRAAVGASNPSSRSARASRSPGATIDMVSAQSESRIRDLMLAVQGQGVKATMKDVDNTATWMIETNRHPLIGHAREILRVYIQRNQKPWKNWDEVRSSLSKEARDAMRTISGPTTREARTLMKREGHKVDGYENSQSIATALIGLSPPKISPSLFEYVCRLLRHAYPTYESASRSGDNFWGGYPYFLRCVLLLLGRDEYLPYINLPSLKNKEEVREHLWRALDWEFVSADPRVTPPAIHMDRLSSKSKLMAKRVLTKGRKRRREMMQ